MAKLITCARRSTCSTAWLADALIGDKGYDPDALIERLRQAINRIDQKRFLGSCRKHNLAEMRVAFHPRVGFGGLGQRKHRVDVRLAAASLQERPDLFPQGVGDHSLLRRRARA